MNQTRTAYRKPFELFPNREENCHSNKHRLLGSFEYATIQTTNSYAIKSQKATFFYSELVSYPQEYYKNLSAETQMEDVFPI